MTTVSATEAKQNFAALIDKAQREPVCIRRHQRDVAVLISAEEYERVRKARAEELIRFTSATSRFATRQGLNDHSLNELLAEEG